MALVFFGCWIVWGLGTLGPIGFVKELFAPKGESSGALRVLLRDADLRRHMGAVGAQRAREEFHAAAVVGSLERLYERLLVDAGQSQ